MTSHQWRRTPFLVIRQTELVQMSSFQNSRFFAHGKSQDPIAPRCLGVRRHSDQSSNFDCSMKLLVDNQLPAALARYLIREGV